jgi:hypothetical protein
MKSCFLYQSTERLCGFPFEKFKKQEKRGEGRIVPSFTRATWPPATLLFKYITKPDTAYHIDLLASITILVQIDPTDGSV